MPEQEQAKPNGSLKLARPYHENKLGFMGATKAGQSHSICVIRAEYQQLQFQGVFELSSGDVLLILLRGIGHGNGHGHCQVL